MSDGFPGDIPRSGPFKNGSWQDSGPPKRQIGIEWYDQIKPASSEWLVKGVLPLKGLACIYGPSGSGKSFVAVDFALRIAAGLQVLDLKTQAGAVVYVGAEGANGIRKRVIGWGMENGYNEFLPFAFVADTFDFTKATNDDVTQFIARMTEETAVFNEHGGLKVIVLDTMARLMAGYDEISGRDMGDAVKALERIAAEMDCLVIVVHHTGKNEAAKERGHSSFRAALDASIEISRQTTEDGGEVRALELSKVKDEEDGRRWIFNLEKLTLGTDEDGDDVTTCVVNFHACDPTEARKPKKAKEKPGEQIVRKAIAQLLSEGKGVIPPHQCQAPNGVLAVLKTDLRKRAIDLGLAPAASKNPEDATRRALDRAVQGLVASGSVYQREQYLWLGRE